MAASHHAARCIPGAFVAAGQKKGALPASATQGGCEGARPSLYFCLTRSTPARCCTSSRSPPPSRRSCASISTCAVPGRSTDGHQGRRCEHSMGAQRTRASSMSELHGKQAERAGAHNGERSLGRRTPSCSKEPLENSNDSKLTCRGSRAPVRHCRAATGRHVQQSIRTWQRRLAPLRWEPLALGSARCPAAKAAAAHAECGAAGSPLCSEERPSFQQPAARPPGQAPRAGFQCRNGCTACLGEAAGAWDAPCQCGREARVGAPRRRVAGCSKPCVAAQLAVAAPTPAMRSS